MKLATRPWIKKTPNQTLIPDEIVFSEGATHFDHLLDDIHHAKYSIDLETYIFQKDF